MSPLLAAVPAAAAAVVLSAGLARVAGLGRPRLRSGARAGHPLLLLPVLAALPMTLADHGDVVVASLLLAVVVARRSPPLAAAVLLVAVAGALRVGSSAAADLAGAHGVLGPAVSSPLWHVAAGAALVGAAALGPCALLVGPRPRRGWRGVATAPGMAAELLVAPVVALLAVAVAAGPVLVDGADGSWILPRAGAAVGLLVVGAAGRRLLRRRPAWEARVARGSLALASLGAGVAWWGAS